MSDQSKLGIGKIITTEQQRDAIHVAVAPVVAAMRLLPGMNVGLDKDGRATNRTSNPMGVVDPFLMTYLDEGEKFWLFLYPGSITSLRHDWTHPAFDKTAPAAKEQSESEKWMRGWAKTHMTGGYYDQSEEAAYEYAIQAGHDLSVGGYENSRDYIDDEWWNHWENITGQKGQRGEYFSCAC